MTTSTFADLKSQVAAAAQRSNLTAQIPFFVQQAETRIYYGSEEQPFPTEPLRIRAMEASQYATFNAQKIQLPTRFVQQRRLYITGTPNIRVDYVIPEQFWDKWLSSTSGQPSQYTVEGENLVLGPTPDSSYTGQMLFYQRFASLSADADTNWLLVNAPGVYLYGTLLELYKYARNMEQAQASLNSFSGLVNALNSSNKADRFSGPWAATTSDWTP